MVVGLLATLFAARAIADPVTSVREGLERVAERRPRRPRRGRRRKRGRAAAGGLQPHGRGPARARAAARPLRPPGRPRRRAPGASRRHQARRRGARGRRCCSSTSSARRRWRWRCRRPRSCGCSTSSSASSSRPPKQHGGLVNKFQGDAALCVFGAPVASDDPAGDALRAARAMAAPPARGGPPDRLRHRRLGGPAVAGNVGAEQRFEYTVIGDPVNEAARLSALAKRRDGGVLSSEAALRRVARDRGLASGRLDEFTILAGRAERTGIARAERGCAPPRPDAPRGAQSCRAGARASRAAAASRPARRARRRRASAKISGVVVVVNRKSTSTSCEFWTTKTIRTISAMTPAHSFQLRSLRRRAEASSGRDGRPRQRL